MYLFELFDEQSLDVTDNIKSSLMDILTPLVASEVPFVTFNQLIDKMNSSGTGLSIDRALIMDLLDPDKVKMVSKIEGDRIYLTSPDGADRSVTKDDAVKDQEHVSKMATDQASKSMDSL
jgi:hypothetical protein